MSFTLSNLEYVLVPATVVLAGSFLLYHHRTQKPTTNYLLSTKISPSSSAILEFDDPNMLEKKSTMHSPILSIAEKLTQEPITFEYQEATHNPKNPGKRKKITFSFSLKPDGDNWVEEYKNVFTKNHKHYEIIRWIPKDSENSSGLKDCRYSWTEQEMNQTTRDLDSARLNEQFRSIVRDSNTTCKSDSNKGITIEEIDDKNNIKKS